MDGSGRIFLNLLPQFSDMDIPCAIADIPLLPHPLKSSSFQLDAKDYIIAKYDKNPLEADELIQKNLRRTLHRMKRPP